jgi:hypothetical protein
MTVNVKEPSSDITQVKIPPLRMAKIDFHIIGTAPLMVCKFSAKAQHKMERAQEAGSAAKTKKNRDARNFAADCDAARHIFIDGAGEENDGISAAAFRNASIDACRAAGFVMTKAKLGIFCEPDGFDREDGTPLVRILSDAPFEMSKMAVRNANGSMDIRARPMWREWKMIVRLRFDLDIFSTEDIANLLRRVGEQVGIGEGRPFGSTGFGMGCGLFTIEQMAINKGSAA